MNRPPILLSSAFLILCLWSVFPASAFGASLWKGVCEQNLMAAVTGSIADFDADFSITGHLDERYPRLLAATYAPCVDKITAIADQIRWLGQPDIRAPYLVELRHTGEILKSDTAAVYAMAQKYRDQTGDFDSLLYRLLSHWAIEQNFEPAIYDNIQAQFAENSGGYIIGKLRFLASTGYVPAMVDAARRFLTGDGVEKNLGNAYYWIKRAEAAHGDLSGVIHKPYERLIDLMNANEKRSLEGCISYFGPFK